VPYVPINVPIGQAIKIDKLDFYRVCLQSAAINFNGVFFDFHELTIAPRLWLLDFNRLALDMIKGN
jgi:hypothetical protein